MKIAIDGPAGSGKSSIAKEIANRLEILYIDTGAMYRAITLKLLRADESDYEKILKETKINFDDDKIFLDGRDVSKEIRENEISNKTSEFSKKKIIRDYLVKMQREIAKNRDVVMEGRDIGSVVLKDAEYKFFLTADVETRAMRRYKQLGDDSLNFEDVLADLKLRDYNDSHRENSPLIKTDDAILIDSTDLNAEETIEKIISYIKRWSMFYKFVQVFIGFFVKIIYRIEVLGTENIPLEDKRLIVCGNHKSNLDPVTLSAIFPRQIHWMAKKELFQYKILGGFLKKMGAFPVDRNNNDLKAVKTALKILKNEDVLGIFPEATRVTEIDYTRIKSGVALIAQKTNSEVLPVFIEGDYKPFRKNRIYFRKPVKINKEIKYSNEELENISQDIMRMVYGDEIKWKLL